MYKMYFTLCVWGLYSDIYHLGLFIMYGRYFMPWALGLFLTNFLVSLVKLDAGVIVLTYSICCMMFRVLFVR